MVLSVLLKFLFPPPPSFFVSAVSIMGIVSMANAGFSEIRGKNLQYSKFRDANSSGLKKIQVSGKAGMLLAYAPAFLVGVASFGILPRRSLRSTLLQSAVTLHFFKRIFEVLFIHKYSGTMALDTAILIPISYFQISSTMIFAQHLTERLPDPPIDLQYLGIALFLLGIGGNFYHHFLLSKLRKEGEKEYKIPRGGLFNLVICPHYLFEIIEFLGVSFISQTFYAFSFTLSSTMYLMGRSYATRRWYLSKFENFPNDDKALVPFVF